MSEDFDVLINTNVFTDCDSVGVHKIPTEPPAKECLILQL